jgi:hypothetical protein
MMSKMFGFCVLWENAEAKIANWKMKIAKWEAILG